MAIPLSTVISVSISVADRSVTQQGFGTPLILTSDQAFAPDRVKTYSASTWSTSMLADGFVATDAVYAAASAMMAQDQKVNTFKVARRDVADIPTQSFTLTPLQTADGNVYSVLIDSETFTYTTTGGSDTVANIIDQLDILITAGSAAVTVTDNITTMDIDADVAGSELNIRFVGPFTVVDGTTDGGVATSLATVLAADSDWYGLVITSSAPAEVIAAGTWVEANNKRYYAMSQESAPLGGTGTGATIKASGLNYTKLIHNQDPGDYPDAAILSKEFSFLPGTYTTTYMGLSGVSISEYTQSQLTALFDDNVGVVESFGGVNVFFDGQAASGRFVDITRTIDWLEARIQEAVANLFVNVHGKIPFTDAGIAQVKGVIMGVLQLGVNRGVFVGEGSQAPEVTAPLAANVSAGNKSSRTLPDVTFSVVYTGAIEAVTITGTVSLT